MGESLGQNGQITDPRYRFLADAMPCIVWVGLPSGKVIFGNQRWTDYFGVSVESRPDGDWTPFVHPDDLTDVRAKWQNALETCTPCVVEYRLLRQDGVYRWHRCLAQPETHGEERIGWIGTLIDIDDEKTSKASLDLAESSLALALKGGKMGWWIRDIETDLVRWSPELEELFGLEVGSFAGSVQAFMDFVHPDDRTSLRQSIQNSIRDGRDYSLEFRFHRIDGSEGWMEGRGKAVYNADGNAVALYGVGIDISARKEQEARLHESEERMRLALAAAGLGAWEVDANTDIAEATEGIGPLYGRAAGFAHASVDDWLADIHPDDRQRIRQLRDRLISHGTPYEAEYRVVHPDGKVRWLYSKALRLIAADGSALKTVGVVSDITDRKEFESQLKDANEVLERKVCERTADLRAALEALQGFTYHVSHDLRAPLRAIVSTSRLIQEDYGDRLPEDGHELLTRQANAARRLGDLIDDLLHLSRLSRAEIAREVIDLTAMTHEVCQESKSLHPDRQVHFTVMEGLEVVVDPRLFRLALSNLVENAVKYSPSGGEIAVGRAENGHLYVRDQGIGMEHQYLDKIFEPFQRLHRDDEFSGTGIGLANVRQVIDRHEGRVWAESSPGEGSTFWINLPSRFG